MCRTALSLIAEGGATPEEEPCCTLMEMTTALLALTAAGRGDHWDTVDRWFRNTVVECQFRDPAALNRGYAPGEPKPWDDTRDIVNRSLGGFFWASPYEYLCWRIRLMTCCSGHAIWTLGKIADHAVMDEGPAGGISVNLHYTLETPLAAVSCHEPFAGRLEVVPARTGPVRIRVPSFATGVTVSLDGAEVPHAIRDGYWPSTGPGRRQGHAGLPAARAPRRSGGPHPAGRRGRHRRVLRPQGRPHRRPPHPDQMARQHRHGHRLRGRPLAPPAGRRPRPGPAAAQAPPVRHARGSLRSRGRTRRSTRLLPPRPCLGLVAK